MAVIANPVSLALTAAGAIAFGTTGFLSDAPNRLADGIARPLWQAPGLPVAAIVLCLAVLGLTSLRMGRAADGIALAAAALLAGALLVAAGLFAQDLVVPGHPAQRQALGPAFWLGLAVALLAVLDAMQRLSLSLLARAGWLVSFVAVFAGLQAAGVFASLSLAREFASHGSLFVAAVATHIVLVVASVGLSIVICAPLVLAVRRSPRAGRAIYSGLGLLQTVPSIALFGLLIAPLTLLSAHVPVLKRLGVEGLGATPALIALVLYAAFPLVRMSDAAFTAVPAAVRDAATGLGFGRRRRFLAVDLPLALPILVSGLRVVTLQAIGLATVAALIGGGGLGTFIFEGIGEYALDLVLVGALPVILLALAADFGFRIVLSRLAAAPAGAA